MSNSDTPLQTSRAEVEALRHFVRAYDAFEEVTNQAEVPEAAYDEAAAQLADARVALDPYGFPAPGE